MSVNRSHFHRFQYSKALKYIRENLSGKIFLEEIAKASGSSKYHFIRIFKSYSGESPFKLIQRIRIKDSLRHLENDKLTITEISQAVGFETPSSFNKVFKCWTGLAPSDFRNIGKAQKDKVRYSLAETPKNKELKMTINLTNTPEVIERSETTILTLKTVGEYFYEIAPAVWVDFLNYLEPYFAKLNNSEFMGLSRVINGVEVEGESIYKAAVSIPFDDSFEIEGLEKEVLPRRKYAKFVLKGPHVGVWAAFDESLKIVNNSELELDNGECLEVYLNDPGCTPEEELLTEILIPIK